MKLEFETLNAETEEAQIEAHVEKWFTMYREGKIDEKHLKDVMIMLALNMRDPDYKVSGKKEFIVGLEDVKPIEGGYLAIGRNGDKDLHVGEYLNNCRIEKIHAWGQEHETLGRGHTAALTLKGRFLSFSMRDYMWPWSWRKETGK